MPTGGDQWFKLLGSCRQEEHKFEASLGCRSSSVIAWVIMFLFQNIKQKKGWCYNAALDAWLVCLWPSSQLRGQESRKHLFQLVKLFTEFPPKLQTVLSYQLQLYFRIISLVQDHLLSQTTTVFRSSGPPLKKPSLLGLLTVYLPSYKERAWRS